MLGTRASLCDLWVFVLGPALVVEDGEQGLPVLGIRVELGIHVLRLDDDDRAVMPGCGDLWLRLIGDRDLFRYVRAPGRRPSLDSRSVSKRLSLQEGGGGIAEPNAR